MLGRPSAVLLNYHGKDQSFFHKHKLLCIWQIKCKRKFQELVAIFAPENSMQSQLHTVGAQSIARAQSKAPRHSTYVIMPKKPKFSKIFVWKD
jgi:hypothetical protein